LFGSFVGGSTAFWCWRNQLNVGLLTDRKLVLSSHETVWKSPRCNSADIPQQVMPIKIFTENGSVAHRICQFDFFKCPTGRCDSTDLGALQKQGLYAKTDTKSRDWIPNPNGILENCGKPPKKIVRESGKHDL
jgi:hypothetical protein